MLTTLQGQWIPAHCAPLDRISVRHPTNHSAPPSRLGCESSLAFPLVPWKPRWPMVAEEDGAFPVEQSLAPTVVESNVPERTRRRGEYGARVSGRKITVSFFVPLSAQTARTNQAWIFLGGFYRVFSSQGGGKRGIGAASFFFLFSFFSSSPSPPPHLKRGFCASRWFVLRSRRKNDGRRGRSEGATEAESRLFDAIIKREEAHDQLAESLRHLHTPGKASRWR